MQVGSSPFCPFPLSPAPTPVIPPFLASTAFWYSKQTIEVCGDPHPCLRGASGFASPLLVVRLPTDPKGLACNSLSSGLRVFPVCCTLPAPPGSGPSASPCLSLQTQVSCVCRQSHASQWGPGLQKGHFQGTLGAAAGRAEATV